MGMRRENGATLTVVLAMATLLSGVLVGGFFGAPGPVAAGDPETNNPKPWTCDEPGENWNCVMNATKIIEINSSEGGPQTPYGGNASIGCHYETMERNGMVVVYVWTVPDGCEFHAFDVWKISFMSNKVKMSLTVNMEMSSLGSMSLAMDVRSGSSYDHEMLVDHGEDAKGDHMLDVDPETMNLVVGGTVWAPPGTYRIVLDEAIFVKAK